MLRMRFTQKIQNGGRHTSETDRYYWGIWLLLSWTDLQVEYIDNQLQYLGSQCLCLNLKIVIFFIEKSSINDSLSVFATERHSFLVTVKLLSMKNKSQIIPVRLISESLKRMLNLNQPITKSTAVEPVWKVLTRRINGGDTMSALVSPQGTYWFPWLPVGVLEREAYYKGIL